MFSFAFRSILFLILLLSLAVGEVEYIPLPPQAEPLNNMLPQKGISDGMPLKATKPPITYEHSTDFENRGAVISAGATNNISRDTLPLWNAYYPELAVYTMDMFNIGFNRLWLNSLIGQEGGGVDAALEGSLFDISLPMTLPAWMKDFGFNRPKLLLQGTMDIRFHGMGVHDNRPGSVEGSLWPSPSLSYDPSFTVKGKVGRNITVEINNTEGGLGIRNRVRLVYEESKKGEFEDYILQRVEAGNTSLDLAGTELTGYSEKHQGLFGLKAELKFGNWRLTTIASQDAASQESYTIKGRDDNSEFQIQDIQFVSYKYYFLNHTIRNAYINSKIEGRLPPNLRLTGLKIYKRSPQNNENTGVIRNVTGVYRPPNSTNVERIPNLDITEMVNGEDYVFEPNTGILRVKNGSVNMLIAASWGANREDGTNRQTPSVNPGDEVVLIQYDQAHKLTDIGKLMLRNVYNVGINSSNASNFILRLKDRSRTTVDYLKTLGVADSINGTILTGDVDIFRKDGAEYTGDMFLPCRDIAWYRSRGVINNPENIAKERCLEPFRNVDSSATMASLYTMPVQNLKASQSLYYFEAVGKRRRSSISVRDPNSSYSVGGGGCMDIAQGSEKLKAGSEVLVRDVDYQVNYELGQIELISERALDPNKEITVNFECEPLFSLQSKLLLGARAEYPIKYFGEGSILGLTALYKNQTVSAESPRLGGEPFSSFLWGANIRLQDSSKVLSKIINAVPFIKTKEASRWSFESEFAATYHNANTSKKRSALIDDFENSVLSSQYPLTRTSWFQASPPGGDLKDLSTYIKDLDYKHAGEFVWHSNSTMLYRYIHAPIGNSDVDNRELTILNFRLRPNDNLSGKSWGGVMRANSVYDQNLSEKKYIEIVAQGNVGSLFIDLGAVSEDISINGFEPNGKLNSENTLGTTIARHDNGLAFGSEEENRRIVWDCRYSECRADTLTNSGTNTDVARQKFDPDMIYLNDPPPNINGTAGNAGERAFDSEDINGNGMLDTYIDFVRYRIDLSEDDPTKFEILQNGWRKFRIPIEQFDSIVSGVGSSLDNILSRVGYTRLWYGKLGNGISEGRVRIAEFSIVGNEWNESAGRNEFGISTPPITQEIEGGGFNTGIYAPGTVVEPDSNYLRVQVINNRDNTSSYFVSPNTPIERDANTNAPLKEQSLKLEYGGLHRGQAVSAVRFFDNEIKDFTSYNNIKMEIHYETKANKTPVRFALQFGRGNLDGSSDYYEWSFKPKKYVCPTDQRIQDCHERNWRENAFSLPLAEFSNLKSERPFLKSYEKELHSSDSTRKERIKIVGNPSQSQIDWLRFVVIADDDASLADLEETGTFWVNDLRLSGMDNAWGYAVRTHGQLDFADVLSLSGELRYQDGNFATLRSEGKSPKPTASEANTRFDINGTASLNVNKFFKDEYGLHIPLGIAYSSTTIRPYLKPDDDLKLSQDNATDMFGDFVGNNLEIKDLDEEGRLRDSSESKGYQSFLRTRTFSLGFSKDYNKSKNIFKEVLGQVFLERPAFNYSYREVENRSAKSADSSYQYNTTIEYKLGAFERTNIFLFGNKSLPLELWPQTFDITFMDLSYNRNVNQERDPNFLEPQVERIANWTTDLMHKADIRWNILPFLNFNYTINITRDMYANGDRQAFAKEDFFNPYSSGGLFAAGYIFDHDHTDRQLFVTNADYEYILDTLHNDSTGQDSIVRMISRSYTLDSVGSREYGRAYGILRGERNRRQEMRLNFTPEMIPFLPMRFSFSSGFIQNKSIPDNFDFWDEQMLSKNFWTINHNNRFEFSPTLRLSQLAAIRGKNAVSNFLEKIKWREIRGTWTVDLQTAGEDFTLWQLYEEQGVSPMQYYLFGLGFGDGYGGRGFWNLVSGDMGLNKRKDYEKFAQYRNKNIDSLVYLGRFEHSVRRTLTGNTSLTLPFWDISVRGDLGWSEQFKQTRENPLELDTATIWPKIGVGVDVPNFAHRFAFLQKKLRSLSTAHRLDYVDSRTVRPFQGAEDERQTVIDLNPLIRISALTQGNIRIDNSIRFKMDERRRMGKEALPGVVLDVDGWEEDYYITAPWVNTSLEIDKGYALGDELAVSYSLKTKRGFQIWRWYVKLLNDIELKLTSGYSYKRETRDTYIKPIDFNAWQKESGTDGVHAIVTQPSGSRDTTYKPKLERMGNRETPIRAHEWYIKPSAGYTFNKMASASAYIEYRRLTELLEDNSEHTRQSLAFEIAVMLKFQ